MPTLESNLFSFLKSKHINSTIYSYKFCIIFEIVVFYVFFSFNMSRSRCSNQVCSLFEVFYLTILSLAVTTTLFNERFGSRVVFDRHIVDMKWAHEIRDINVSHNKQQHEFNYSTQTKISFLCTIFSFFRKPINLTNLLNRKFSSSCNKFTDLMRKVGWSIQPMGFIELY